MNTFHVLKGQAMKIRRRLILIDIENINGGPIRSFAGARMCMRILQGAVKVAAGDLVVIACNGDKNSLFNVFLVWGSSPRLIPGYGPDGADLALLEVLDENVEDRFDEVILARGDGIFAERVAQLAKAGLPTRVISHAHSLSARLRLAATTTSMVAFEHEADSVWKEGA